MIKTLKKIEIGLGILFLIAIICSLNRLPFSDEILIVLAGTLVLFYVALGVALYPFNKDDTSGAKFGKIVFSFYSGNNFAVCILGILFSVMLWPNSRQMILVGILSIVIIGMITIILLLIFKSEYFKKLMITNVLIGTLTLFFYYTPEDNIIDYKYRDKPECAEIVKKYMKDPHNKELKRQFFYCTRK